jgi:hypothetical protein
VAWDKPLPFLKLNTTHTMSMEGTAPVQSKINALWMSIKNEKLGIDAEKKEFLNKITLSSFLKILKTEKQIRE